MSSSDITISVKDLAKIYRIGAKEQIHDSLGGAIVDFVRRPLANFHKYRSLYKFDDIDTRQDSDGGTNHSNIIWALRNVSFDVREGEVLGIIGRNGAGKSTLLKILSKITPPTRGQAEIHGRVSSLLEVGTGFHQELTGRENIYLNGTIMGMKKREVDRKFAEIVDFAGVDVERFLDTPVKRYSSGMRVRLAFAVAAYLEPDILLVDEVLAVGDAAFQKKCLNKMQDVSHLGRTVLFVSHNMGAVADLCERTVWLDHGKVRLDGPSSDIVAAYLSAETTGTATWYYSGPASPDKDVQLKHARVLSARGQISPMVNFDSSFKIEIAYRLRAPVRGLTILCRITNVHGNVLWTSWDTDTTDWEGRIREPGDYCSTCTIPRRLLRPGRYYVSVGTRRIRHTQFYESVLTFDVSEVGYTLHPGRKGILTPHLSWEIAQVPQKQ